MPSMSGLSYSSSTLACRRRFCEGALGDHWRPVVSDMDNGLERAEPAAEPSAGLAHHVANAGDAGHRASMQLGSFSARWSRCGIQPAGRFAVCCDGSSVDEWNNASTQNSAAQNAAAGSRGGWRLREYDHCASLSTPLRKQSMVCSEAGGLHLCCHIAHARADANLILSRLTK